MSILDKLREKGWYLTETGLNKLTENQNNVQQSENYSAVIKIALDHDLRDIAGGAIACKGDNQIPGNVVLQIMKIRNVSAPKANEDSKVAPKLLKLQLTDGQTQYNAVEIENIPSLTLNTPPGTKIFLKNGPIKISHGMLLIDSKNVDILGGNVASLVEKWEVNRSLAKYAKGGRINLSSSGPPRFIPFGKEIPNLKSDEPFNSLTEAQTGQRNANDENSEFNSQRTEAISEAIKTETKKVFGGGTKQLLDANVQKVMDKGYSEEQARNALRFNKNNVDYAINSLKKRYERNAGVTDRNESNTKNVPNKRTNRADRSEKEECSKPSGKISLFDFVEDKLPIVSDSGISTKTMQDNNKKSDSNDFANNKYDKNRSQNKFENNMSSSFANRGKYHNESASNSNNYYGKNYENRPNQYGGRSNQRENMTERNDNSANRYSNMQRDNTNYQSNNRYQGKDRGSNRNEGYGQTNKNQMYNQKQNDATREKDRQNNYFYDAGYQNKNSQYQGRNQGHENHSRPQKSQGYQKNEKTSGFQTQQASNNIPQNQQHVKHHKQQFNKQTVGHQQQINQLEKATTNMKISSQSQNVAMNHQQPSQSTVQKVVPHVVSAPSFVPNNGSFNPYQIVGFQNKATNEFAMNVLKTQQLPTVAAPPQQTMVPIVPISNVPLPTGLVPQPVATFAAPLPPHPPVIPSPKPSQAFQYAQAPPGATVFAVPGYQFVKLNKGDLCMAKYWEDGRFYPAEITATSESTNVVRFVDYGNFEEVLKTDCYPMNTTTLTTGQQIPATATRPTPGPHFKVAVAHQRSAQPNITQTNKYRDQRVYVPPPAQRK